MKALAVTAVVLSILASSVALASAPASASNSLVNKINKTRANHGLPALRESRGLARTSRRYARHLMAIDWLGHAARIRAPRRYRRLGEVLALTRGWRLRRSRAVRAWLNSPAHRRILLSRSFNQVGAGVSRGRFHGRPSTIWVAQFGR